MTAARQKPSSSQGQAGNLSPNIGKPLLGCFLFDLVLDDVPVLGKFAIHQPCKAHPTPSWRFLTLDLQPRKVPGQVLQHWVKFIFLNLLLTMSEQHRTGPWGCVCENWRPSPIRPGGGFWIYPCDGVSDMSADNVRPEANPLFAFTLAIAGAFIVGLPMAVAIIWICS
jgi:hypothetical protein